MYVFVVFVVVCGGGEYCVWLGVGVCLYGVMECVGVY